MPRILQDIVETTRLELLQAGLKADEARLDSELLARHVLGWDRARYIVSRRQIVPEPTAQAIAALVRRRVKREPFAYIVGEKEFWGRPFSVGPGVLIPRPETELIIETVRDVLHAVPRDTGRLVDVGTGLGCLAISLAFELPGWTLTATEIASGALAVARANAARHGVSERIGFVECDLLAAVPGPVDVVVSNPPYAAVPDRPALQAEVRDYEPAAALFAGLDGLDTIRRLITEAVPKLTPGGWLVFEIGAGQAPTVEGLLHGQGGLTDIAIVADLQGIPRTARARRRR